MQNRIEDIEIRVALLKRLHVFVEHFFGTVTVRRTRRRSVTVTELHDRFIVWLLAPTANNVLVVIVNPSTKLTALVTICGRGSNDAVLHESVRMNEYREDARHLPGISFYVHLYNLNICSAVSARFFFAISGFIVSSAVVIDRRIGK